MSDLPATAPTIVVITGMSGSGKSTAIRALEDAGFFCIDNLPVLLLPKLTELAGELAQPDTRLALVVDAREGDFLQEAPRRPRRGSAAPATRSRCSSSTPRDDAPHPPLLRDAPPPPAGARTGSVAEGIRPEREALARPARAGRPGHRHLRAQRARPEAAGAGPLRPEPATRPPASPSCPSATATACRRRRTWSSTCASCPTRTSSPSSRGSPGRTRRSRATCSTAEDPGVPGEDRGPLRSSSSPATRRRERRTSPWRWAAPAASTARWRSREPWRSGLGAGRPDVQLWDRDIEKE